MNLMPRLISEVLSEERAHNTMVCESIRAAWLSWIAFHLEFRLFLRSASRTNSEKTRRFQNCVTFDMHSRRFLELLRSKCVHAVKCCLVKHEFHLFWVILQHKPRERFFKTMTLNACSHWIAKAKLADMLFSERHLSRFRTAFCVLVLFNQSWKHREAVLCMIRNITFLKILFISRISRVTPAQCEKALAVWNFKMRQTARLPLDSNFVSISFRDLMNWFQWSKILEALRFLRR